MDYSYTSSKLTCNNNTLFQDKWVGCFVGIKYFMTFKSRQGHLQILYVLWVLLLYQCSCHFDNFHWVQFIILPLFYLYMIFLFSQWNYNPSHLFMKHLFNLRRNSFVHVIMIFFTYYKWNVLGLNGHSLGWLFNYYFVLTICQGISFL